MFDATVTVSNAFTDFWTSYEKPIEIVAIVVGAVLLILILRFILSRAVARFVSGVKKSQEVDETSELTAGPYLKARAVQRTRTLGSVGRNIITWVIALVAITLILSQLGLNVGALLASAGIIAAGLAFGAQNIVKDILNGIFMVFEDQLGIGDVVKIGEISGTVEDVGIRVTQVRALDGTLWFIRNGEILTLGNSSQGWGRAVIDMDVDTDQDLQQASDAMLEAAKKIMESQEFARKVTGIPEMRGLETITGDRATLRITIRTRPEAQWEVQRALRAEISRTFVKQGIRLAPEKSA